jgi:hypothetical protein
MRMTHRPAGFAGLIVTLALAGCGPKPAPSAQAPAAPVADPNAVALGKTNTAGPFQVTLSTPEKPVKAGNVPFAAEVTRDGAQVKDATVKVALSMPKMGMPGPSGALTWKAGRYTGTVRAGMAGEWQADVSVKSAVESGTAAFTFPVKE